MVKWLSVVDGEPPKDGKVGPGVNDAVALSVPDSGEMGVPDDHAFGGRAVEFDEIDRVLRRVLPARAL
jgi:hypothetical protein